MTLRCLRVSGESVPDAEVTFRPGLNVIAGASDTGKSYVVECLEFMLGATSPPSTIEEARSYSSAFLEIESAGQCFVLQRSLDGGDFTLYSSNLAALDPEAGQRLSVKHSSKNDKNASVFLLKLSGLLGRTVRKSKEKSASLTFRHLRQLVVVGEERIFTKESPALSGQYTASTEELSAFRLLLTGEESAKALPVPRREVRKAEKESRLTLLDEWSADIEGELDAIGLNREQQREELAAIDAAISRLLESESASREELVEREALRRDQWKRLREIESRLLMIQELLERFSLLDEHYETDVQRLEMLVEAEGLLAQLPEECCPLCGAQPEAHDHTEAKGPAFDPATLRKAAIAETLKIRSLRADLGATRSSLESEETELSQEHEQLAAHHESTIRDLESRLRPQSTLRNDDLHPLMERRRKFEEAASLSDRLQQLDAKRKSVIDESNQTVTQPEFKKPGASDAEPFCRVVQELLASWHFPNLERVVFSEGTQDIVISGKARGAHGKGYRALSHAAFLIGLMKQCRMRSLPHPGFVIIDSPLVTLKSPKKADLSEVIGDEAKRAFYSALATERGGQIVIFENDEPEDPSGMHYVPFTKNEEVGRSGFF